MNQLPIISIVVPTHNRSALLSKNLKALSQQSWPASKFEVVVVADTCHDDTAEKVVAYSKQAPYQLRLLSHNLRSAAATRNLGAANAHGNVLLFLDDDVIAQPELVRAHMNAQHQDGIVLGYSKPILPEEPSWWQYDARRWWEDTFREIGRPSHRFYYRDFFSGNVSMSAELFNKVGGFDARITGRLEDYELGFRLIKSGATFHFEKNAIGFHYDNTDLQHWLRRIKEEGTADVLMGQHHPEIRNFLFGNFDNPSDRRLRFIRKLVFLFILREWFVRPLLSLASISERLRLRGLWRNIVGTLREYNYWSGVAAAIGGKHSLAAWLQEAPMPPAVESNAPIIDVAKPYRKDVLQGLLKRATSLGLRIGLEGIEVLTIPPQPGKEPLKKEHIDSALQELSKQQFVPALALHMIRSTSGGVLL
jgi:glycosyltransferase involved in cell wall biosynthesis